MNSNNKILVAAACIALSAGQATAQQSDVTFFVIGKHANFQQSASGDLNPVDYSFFAEIFLKADGDADNATLRFPTGETLDYEDMRLASGGRRDNVLLISGKDRYTDFESLQKRYPDGRYTVSFATPGGVVDNAHLEFQRRPLPAAPQLSVSQGSIDACTHLAPGQDAMVRWNEFSEGRADPNGILDDLVFVILTDDEGHRVAHSGRPFSGDSYLTFADHSFLVPGAVLKPDSRYTLSVEHALLDDTTRRGGVPAFTTRAVTSKLELTTAADDTVSCSGPQAIPPLDSQVTMFYYDDLEAAATFYGSILGLQTSIDWDWVKFYKTGPSSNVGIVKQGEGAYHTVQERNAVMLSLVTSDVDAWYDRLAGRDDITLLKPIGSGGGIRSFLLEDPGGYTVEFFQWLSAEE